MKEWSLPHVQFHQIFFFFGRNQLICIIVKERINPSVLTGVIDQNGTSKTNEKSKTRVSNRDEEKRGGGENKENIS